MRLYFIVERHAQSIPNRTIEQVGEILRNKGIHVEMGVVEEQRSRPDRPAPAYDLFLIASRTELAMSLAGVLYAQGARLLNPFPSCLKVQNKIVAAQIMGKAGIPAPRCWITSEFALLRPLLQSTPLMLKPHLCGTYENNRIVRHADELNSLPRPRSPVLIQEYLNGGREKLTLYVAGEHVSAVRRPYPQAGFGFAPTQVTQEMRDVAARCAKAFGLALFELDLLETEDGLKVVDIDYFPRYRGVPEAPQILADYAEGYATGLYPAPDESEPPARVPTAAAIWTLQSLLSAAQ